MSDEEDVSIVESMTDLAGIDDKYLYWPLNPIEKELYASNFYWPKWKIRLDSENVGNDMPDLW